METEYYKVHKRLAKFRNKIMNDKGVFKKEWQNIEGLYPCSDCQGAGVHLRYTKDLYDRIELLNRGQNMGWDSYVHHTPEIILKGEFGNLEPWKGQQRIIIKEGTYYPVEIFSVAKKLKEAQTKKFWEKGLYYPHNEWLANYKKFLKLLKEKEQNAI